MSLETSNICICYLSPLGWSLSLSSYLAFTSLAIFLIQVAYFGLLFGTRNKLMFFMNILVFYLLYYLLWNIQMLIGWERPVTTMAVCSASPCANSWFYSLLNQFAFPDPLFITGFAFGFIYIYVDWKVFHRQFPTILFIVLFLYFILYSVAETTLSRMSIGQYFSNLVVTIIVSAILRLCSGYFFEAFPQYLQEQTIIQRIEHDNRVLIENRDRLLIGHDNTQGILYGYFDF